MDSPITTSSPAAGRTPVSRPSLQEQARARNLSIGPRNLMEVRDTAISNDSSSNEGMFITETVQSLVQ